MLMEGYANSGLRSLKNFVEKKTLKSSAPFISPPLKCLETSTSDLKVYELTLPATQYHLPTNCSLLKFQKQQLFKHLLRLVSVNVYGYGSILTVFLRYLCVFSACTSILDFAASRVPFSPSPSI